MSRRNIPDAYNTNEIKKAIRIQKSTNAGMATTREDTIGLDKRAYRHVGIPQIPDDDKRTSQMG
jgi:hypothetical protein